MEDCIICGDGGVIAGTAPYCPVCAEVLDGEAEEWHEWK